MKSINQYIQLDNSTITLAIKREDLLHTHISGNKYRKLKYNLIHAKEENKDTLLTFGGAYSNHIAALAYAGKLHNFKTIGVIRGDELVSKINENPTLKFAQECGMKFKFETREKYRVKEDSDYIMSLRNEFGDFYLVPEGGTNELAIKGCLEILTKDDLDFDFICCAIGTSGTISGIIKSAKTNQTILGFPSLKGTFFDKEIHKFAPNHSNWKISSDYHFGGYGKVTPELVDFLNKFYSKYKIPLDPIYTGKMVFGVIDLIKKNYFPENSKILVIHTGGLQGIEGMNLKLKENNLPQIEFYD
ncbi:1-aminocyclopropane-1-carboxylate deaminase/D-cysteine desulfhydrase [Flavobacterium sp.]|jgi:1-aminocyclopropane-1-carboxylate deaminase|uniref:1-aminocyclopropane-1-carboxylate deaminase/D-cysteine desulfhydrase n=1 Tax=Flavobacterium sp. TaxID=239 RepID=UPI0037BFACA0